jgi:multimeric flavodoxin WrbA
MKAYIISDQEYQTEQFEQLHSLISSYLTAKNFQIEETQIGRNDLAFCKGCFGCWIKKPGECVISDKIAQINSTSMNSDVVVFLSPVVFGQSSANIKTVLDRWVPNVLPFFITLPDGSTMHPPRYSSYPHQIIIGYDEPLSKDDAQLFTNIIKKHRAEVDALIYQDNNSDITEALDKIELRRVGVSV